MHGERNGTPEQPGDLRSTSSTSSASPTSSVATLPEARPGTVGGSREAEPGHRAHRFRGDVEGLRAVALGAVLLYHAEVSWTPGGYVGVDVFFVISGFLITGLLLREAQSTGRVGLLGFYARRARRLLPAAVVVLASVTALAWLLMSPVERSGVYRDVVASALYVVNWRQASEAVAYSELDAEASPVQHFWSLAVEEQFYLLWPLLVLAVAWWCRGGRRRPRRDPRLPLAVVLGSLAVVSFAYAVRFTAERGDAAYFTTTARAWELAAGGLLALVPAARWQRLGRHVALALGVGGVAALVLAVYGLTEESPFPGPWAALPVAGTAAVIAAGSITQATPVGWLLATRPMRAVGRVSYSWYLWHWPLVVLATAWQGRLPSILLLTVVVLAWVPAYLTYRLVETPVRRARPLAATGPALALGGGCTAVGVALGTVAQAAVPTVALAPLSQTPGAQALASSTAPQRVASALRPLPADATDDRGRAHADGCLVDQESTEVRACVYGDTSSDTTVVLLGDSHALQYSAGLDPVARERGWRLVTLTKSGCTPADVSLYHQQYDRVYEECDTWRAGALERVEELSPALVVTGNRAVAPVVSEGRRLNEEDSAEAMTEGYAKTLRRLADTGAEVTVIADNPYPPRDVPSCVSENLDDLTACAFPTSEGLAYTPVNTDAAREVSGVSLIDPTPLLCPEDDLCPAVIGNALVYRNGTHLTSTYTRTLADWFDRRLPDEL
ncbi:SGNH hydrolase domain-containing protein [Streptomyces sp. 4N509B]|uniref:SGNH hydrolase domain-containing protein n=1 Tax=Streptomyces sp. 4N509B TaxID=3457413 RepID=UPI003FD49D33